MLLELGECIRPLTCLHSEIEAAEEGEDTGGDEAYQKFDENLQIAEDYQHADHPPEVLDFFRIVPALRAFSLEELDSGPYHDRRIGAAVDTNAPQSPHSRVSNRILAEIGGRANYEVPHNKEYVVDADCGACPV